MACIAWFVYQVARVVSIEIAQVQVALLIDRLELLLEMDLINRFFIEGLFELRNLNCWYKKAILF